MRSLSQQGLEIQRVCHRESDVSFGIARPFCLRAIARQLYAVAVGIGEVDRFAHAMIRHALDGHAGVDDATHRAPQIASRWITNREMIEPCMVERGGSSPPALPGIQANVMMIATRRDERRLVAEPHDLVESQARPCKTRAHDRCRTTFRCTWPIPAPAGT